MTGVKIVFAVRLNLAEIQQSGFNAYKKEYIFSRLEGKIICT